MYPQLLQRFSMARLREIREVRGEHDPYQSFWKELENVLNCKNPHSNIWVKMEKDEVVVGDVWIQSIGKFYYKHTVHEFSYLYVDSQGTAIGMHGHNEPVNGGRQIKKIKEWYLFPDGTIYFCDKDEQHQLVNQYDHPIYVLSIKIGSIRSE